MTRKFMRIHPDDNVVVMLEKSERGDSFVLDGREIALLHDVDVAHKVAVQDLAIGDRVVKYGEEIGVATAPIPVGGWVHDHNIYFDYTR